MSKEDNKEDIQQIVKDEILGDLKKEKILIFGIDILIIVLVVISLVGFVLLDKFGLIQQF